MGDRLSLCHLRCFDLSRFSFPIPRSSLYVIKLHQTQIKTAFLQLSVLRCRAVRLTKNIRFQSTIRRITASITPKSTMKLALLTTLAINTAVAYAADDVGFFRGTIPKLFGADQLIDVEAHCEGCQPDYCYLDEPDYDCYKSGYPKCCDKTNKGNCPNNNKPTCEVRNTVHL
mmetsp:Transcript_20986/g.45508  ORF Transcript_20986/g.45508 Transcript_20986/m.45508 type:complete len:172 (-) Transcript_20986:621-1136(-)